MSEIYRIIGSLQSDIDHIKKTQDEINDKIELLLSEYNQRRGMSRMAYWIVCFIGTACGFAGDFLHKYFTT